MLVLAAIAAVLWTTAVPALARAAVRKRLEALAPGAVAFELLDVTPRGMYLVNVAVGEPRVLEADLVELRYAPSVLWTRRLDEARIAGARIQLDMRGERAESGRLDPEDLLNRAVDRIVLEWSVLEIERTNGTWTVPITGVVESAGGATRLEARARPFDLTVAIEGVARPGGDGGVAIDLDGTVDGAAAGWFDARGARFDLSVTAFAEAPALRAVSGDVRASSLSLRGARLDQLEASIDGAGGDTLLSARARSVELAALGLIVDGPSAELPMTARSEADALKVTLPRTGLVRWNGVSGLSKENAFRAGAGAATVDAVAGAAVLAMPAGASGHPVAALGMKLVESVSFQGARVEGTVGAAHGSVRWNADGDGGLEAQMIVSDTKVDYPDASLAVADVHASVPFATGRTETGAFRVGRIAWRGHALPGLDGTVGLASDRVTLDARWPVTAEGTITASGWLENGARGMRGALHAEAASFPIDDADLLTDLVPALESVDLGGAIGLNADLRLEDELSQRLVIEWTGGRLDATALDLTLEDVNAEMTLDRLVPPSTDGPQRIRVSRGRVGDLALADGAIRFTVDDGATVIESASWSMGGQFRTDAFRIVPGAERIEATLFCERLQLETWLPLLTDGRATGRGLMYGRVPVIVEPSRARKVHLGEGFLYAEPGGGEIQVRETEQLEALLRQSGQLASEERLADVTDRIVAALRDFRYTMLRADLIGRDDGLLCRVVTSGRGRTGTPPQEIGSLTINISNVDEVVYDLLNLKAALDDAADSALEQFFDEE